MLGCELGKGKWGVWGNVGGGVGKCVGEAWESVLENRDGEV